jgi:Seed maturation protein
VDFENVVAAIKPKLEKSPDMVTREDANLIHSREVRAHGATEKGGVATQAMSLAAKVRI